MKSKRQTCQSIGRMLRVNVSMVTKPFILWILLQGKASMKTVRQRDRERLYSKRTCLYTDRCSCYCAVRCEDTSASLPLRGQYNTTCSSCEIDDLQLRTDLLGPLWKMFKVCKVSQVLLNSREFLTVFPNIRGLYVGCLHYVAFHMKRNDFTKPTRVQNISSPDANVDSFFSAFLVYVSTQSIPCSPNHSPIVPFVRRTTSFNIWWLCCSTVYYKSVIRD